MSITWRSLVPKKHWRAGYFIDRARLSAWQRAHPDAPWLAPEAVHFLDQWLCPSDQVVEFGAGRSTVWFAKRVRRVVSIEHDGVWYAHVHQALAAASVTNVDAILVPTDEADYLGAVNDRIERADLALVDGRNRDRCALWALDRVRKGGLVVIDNAERYLPSSARGPEALGPSEEPPSLEWRAFANAVADLRKVWYDCGVWSTLLVFV